MAWLGFLLCNIALSLYANHLQTVSDALCIQNQSLLAVQLTFKQGPMPVVGGRIQEASKAHILNQHAASPLQKGGEKENAMLSASQLLQQASLGEMG